MSLDSLLYSIRSRVPSAFSAVERLSRGLTVLRHSRRRRRAFERARVSGTVHGFTAEIRRIWRPDVSTLHRFLTRMPDVHIRFFQPHEFRLRALKTVLTSRAICAYGLFAGERMIAYSIVKLFPTRSAYCGLLVAPDMVGRGLGKFLWRYLIWQCVLMGVEPNATVHEDNAASIGSLRAIKPGVQLMPLEKGYHRVLIPTTADDRSAPDLCL